MAEATKHEGTPARTRSTRHAVRDFRNFREGDTIHYVGMHGAGVDVERTEETPATPDTYTLRLSHDEAKTLADVLSSVGGDPEMSRRKFSQAILDALGSAGVDYGGSRGEAYVAVPDLRGIMHFSNGPDNPYV